MKKNSKFKNWVLFNKGPIIMVGITVAYTLIMIAIIYGLGGDLFSCASGSLSDTTKETIEIETSVNRPE
jgi:hypothetical protein